jgi:hypothetical protein
VARDDGVADCHGWLRHMPHPTVGMQLDTSYISTNCKTVSGTTHINEQDRRNEVQWVKCTPEQYNCIIVCSFLYTVSIPLPAKLVPQATQDSLWNVNNLKRDLRS